ncbi:hypothetical protein [Corallococcus exercitus]|uniref:hypothetical protein n=1 Tax=Corallococcus exercitus TaxID=2316736 RepID=UPI0035D40FEE
MSAVSDAGIESFSHNGHRMSGNAQSEAAVAVAVAADGGTSQAYLETNDIALPTAPASTQTSNPAMPVGNYNWRDWVSLASDGIGVAGIFVTVATLLTVSKLRRGVLSRTRLPSHIIALQEYATELSNTLANIEENKSAINSTIEKLDSTLSEVIPLTTGESNSKAKSLRTKARVFSGNRINSKDQGWAVYASINGLIVNLQNLIANQQVAPKS